VQRLGLFGGAFNPVHLGHLLVAQAAVEELGLDKLFFIPAWRSPFKQNDETAPADLRLRWLRLALAGRATCEIDQQELLRGGASYTIETARHYAKSFPDAELFYLIGADNVPKLNEWRDTDELSKLLKFAAVPRPGQAHLKAGLPIEYLVPPFVADAIRDSGAYR
jgi:nicotinate-nucleotide adenylyltransferase